MQLKDLPIGSVVYDETSTWNHQIWSGGNLVKYNEPVKWVVVAKNHFKENTVCLTSKIPIDIKPANSTKVNAPWSNLSLRSWLRGDFYNSFSDNFKKNIIDVTTYTGMGSQNNNQVTTIDNVFILSPTELTLVGSQSKGNNGTAISYFTENKNKVFYSDAVVWTRTPRSANTSDMNCIYNGGNYTASADSVGWINVVPTLNLNPSINVTLKDVGIYVLDLRLNKYLLKNNNHYYSVKSQYYSNNQYNLIPELEGKNILTKEDYSIYGFEDLNTLTQNTTINSETFKPIDKLQNQFNSIELLQMKEK